MHGRAPRTRLRGRQWVGLAALALVLVLAGAAAGFGTSTLLPTKYAANADILYSLTREQPTGFLREDRNITTQVVLVESRSVLDPVARQWDMTIEELSDAVSAEVLDESEVIGIQYVDTDPARAEAVMESLVQSYLDVSNNAPRGELRSYLDAELADVLTRISEVRAQAASRQGELAALVEREQWLRTQLDELQFADIVGPGATLLVEPYVDADPVSPRPLVAIAAGAMSGALIAVFGVAVLARRMSRV